MDLAKCFKQLDDAASRHLTRRDLLALSTLCDASYLDDGECTVSGDDSGCQLVNVQNVQCLIAWSAETLVITFRETQNAQSFSVRQILEMVRDWGMNFRALRMHHTDLGGLHIGFWTEYRRIVDAIKTVVEPLTDGRRVIINGHSKGAAIASVFAFFQVDWLTTTGDWLLVSFCSPRWASRRLSGAADAIMRNRHIRVTCGTDVVPWVPLPLRNRHTGRHHYLTREGDVMIALRFMQLRKTRLGQFKFSSIRDHLHATRFLTKGVGALILLLAFMIAGAKGYPNSPAPGPDPRARKVPTEPVEEWSQSVVRLANRTETRDRFGQTVIRNGLCTGVCVSADGYIASTAHCDLKDGVSVEFRDGRSFKADVLKKGGRGDSAVILKIRNAPADLPFRPVRETKPPIGTTVKGMGWRGGEHFTTGTGVVLGTHSSSHDGERYRGILTSPIGGPGWSGGPLFDAKTGEVVAVCNGGEPNAQQSGRGDEGGTRWSDWESLVNGLSEATGLPATEATSTRIVAANVSPRSVSSQRKRRRVVIFTADWCPPCQRLHREFKAPDDVEVVWVRMLNDGPVDEPGELRWSDEALASRFMAQNGPVEGVPTIWIEGSTYYKQNYQAGTAIVVLEWVVRIIKLIGAFFVGDEAVDGAFPQPTSGRTLSQNNSRRSIPQPDLERDDPPTPHLEELQPIPDPKFAPEPPVEPELESGDVEIVVLASKQDVSMARGLARKIAIERGVPIVEAKVDELLKGKVKLHVVTERVDPEKFKSIGRAVGVVGENGKMPFAVFVTVLAKKHDIGFIKGVVVSKVIKAAEPLKEHLPENLTVDVVTERNHAAAYRRIKLAVEAANAQSSVKPIQPYVRPIPDVPGPPPEQGDDQPTPLQTLEEDQSDERDLALMLKRLETLEADAGKSDEPGVGPRDGVSAGAVVMSLLAMWRSGRAAKKAKSAIPADVQTMA